MKRRTAFTLAATVLGSAAVLVLLLMAALAAYKSRYSMSNVTAYEIGSPDAVQRVLIATQGSEFKYALVERLVQQLKERSIYIRVIDVTELPVVRESEWSAIVVVHTWENWRPQKDAASFVERAREKGRLVVVTTSGSGREKMPGVDVISAASELRDVDAAAAQAAARLDAVLAPSTATTG